MRPAWFEIARNEKVLGSSKHVALAITPSGSEPRKTISCCTSSQRPCQATAGVGVYVSGARYYT